MVFLKPKANLGSSEKARIELYFQQIAECIGFDRLHLPVLSKNTIFDLIASKQTPNQIIQFLGKHLNHDTTQIQFHVVPQQPANCSGGG